MIKLDCAYALPSPSTTACADELDRAQFASQKDLPSTYGASSWIGSRCSTSAYCSARPWLEAKGGTANSGRARRRRAASSISRRLRQTMLEGDDDAVAHLASTAGGLNCFSTQRRAMPVQVLGLGAQGVSEKYANLLKCLAQETAAGDIDQRRAWASGTSSRKDKMVDHDRA